MKKGLTTFLILLALFSSITLSLHHHEDGQFHNDCLTCITASHRHSITADIDPGITRSESIIEIITQKSLLVPLKQFISNLTIRSPPL
jgi:hypothetical protein